MGNVCDVSLYGKPITEYSDFLNSILKSLTLKNTLELEKASNPASLIIKRQRVEKSASPWGNFQDGGENNDRINYKRII